MSRQLNEKSTPEQIRSRFDNDVERFSNLETGQTAAIDAAYCLDLIAQAATNHTPNMSHILDIGCGAGNFTLRILQQLKHNQVHVSLNDLSPNMLERASTRIASQTTGQITLLQNDIRNKDLPEKQYDCVVAAMVLHHLREEHEWSQVFQKLHTAIKPGGALWIYDLVEHDNHTLHQLAWQQYSDYLVNFKDAEYRDLVFDYIDQEDSPRPLMWQLTQLENAGFSCVDVLHKHGVCAAYCAFK
ncbi:tRNA (cmo5U34)-methyltransferase [Poriferisphaera corsica]|uniref:tRNA (Cmo5U34)-methyltransferase n=1 Tax=Poriferisphaera corsica TaxID=2528020 RepID=A0A517YW75_9BACT|nr:class I SAM-dependent methyltransferase [Poriferisphaera corsica]QDU34485.1 tRNA (cmo5U34)-methyltransferase [Poriferisphaera corsica]